MKHMTAQTKVVLALVLVVVLMFGGALAYNALATPHEVGGTESLGQAIEPALDGRS